MKPGKLGQQGMSLSQFVSGYTQHGQIRRFTPGEFSIGHTILIHQMDGTQFILPQGKRDAGFGNDE